MSARNLPSDVVHEILVGVPDFITLLAAIQSCKLFNDAFKAHPKSIVHEVLANVAGPAVPQAARCAQYMERVRRAVEDSYDDGGLSVTDLPSEEHYRSLDWTPTKALTLILEENQKAVRRLEDFYSMRHKDRKSATSKLEPEESLRFQRAMYRYWLCLDMLHYGAFEPNDETDTDEDEDEDEDEDRATKLSIKAFLEGFSTDELVEILSVESFCEETMHWQSDARYPYVGIDPGDLAANMDAGHVARSPWSSWDPVPEVIHDILLSRKIKRDDLDSKRSKAILHKIHGAEDICGRCHAVAGLQLIGPSNVMLLCGILPITHWQLPTKISLLPGLLPRNASERNALTEYLLAGNNGRAISERDLLHELIDIVPDADGTDGEAHHQWSKDEWYCLECIKDLFRQRFMVWWRQKKEKNGELQQDDCWYGYNCRTMTHRPAHALKLNHLCTPTRGDAPEPLQQPNNPN